MKRVVYIPGKGWAEFPGDYPQDKINRLVNYHSDQNGWARQEKILTLRAAQQRLASQRKGGILTRNLLATGVAYRAIGATISAIGDTPGRVLNALGEYRQRLDEVPLGFLAKPPAGSPLHALMEHVPEGGFEAAAKRVDESKILGIFRDFGHKTYGFGQESLDLLTQDLGTSTTENLGLVGGQLFADLGLTIVTSAAATALAGPEAGVAVGTTRATKAIQTFRNALRTAKSFPALVATTQGSMQAMEYNYLQNKEKLINSGVDPEKADQIASFTATNVGAFTFLTTMGFGKLFGAGVEDPFQLLPQIENVRNRSDVFFLATKLFAKGGIREAPEEFVQGTFEELQNQIVIDKDVNPTKVFLQGAAEAAGGFFGGGTIHGIMAANIASKLRKPSTPLESEEDVQNLIQDAQDAALDELDTTESTLSEPVGVPRKTVSDRNRLVVRAIEDDNFNAPELKKATKELIDHDTAKQHLNRLGDIITEGKATMPEVLSLLGLLKQKTPNNKSKYTELLQLAITNPETFENRIQEELGITITKDPVSQPFDTNLLQAAPGATQAITVDPTEDADKPVDLNNTAEFNLAPKTVTNGKEAAFASMLGTRNKIVKPEEVFGDFVPEAEGPMILASDEITINNVKRLGTLTEGQDDTLQFKAIDDKYYTPYVSNQDGTLIAKDSEGNFHRIGFEQAGTYVLEETLGPHMTKAVTPLPRQLWVLRQNDEGNHTFQAVDTSELQEEDILRLGRLKAPKGYNYTQGKDPSSGKPIPASQHIFRSFAKAPSQTEKVAKPAKPAPKATQPPKAPKQRLHSQAPENTPQDKRYNAELIDPILEKDLDENEPQKFIAYVGDTFNKASAFQKASLVKDRKTGLQKPNTFLNALLRADLSNVQEVLNVVMGAPVNTPNNRLPAPNTVGNRITTVKLLYKYRGEDIPKGLEPFLSRKQLLATYLKTYPSMSDQAADRVDALDLDEAQVMLNELANMGILPDGTDPVLAFMLLYHTGMRPGSLFVPTAEDVKTRERLVSGPGGGKFHENQVLHWGDIDFANGVITLPSIKGHTAYQVPLQEGLRKYLLANHKEKLFGEHSRGEDDRIFPDPKQKGNWNDARRQAFYVARETEDAPVANLLRHTFTTNLFRNGVDNPEVARRLEGSEEQVATAKKYYIDRFQQPDQAIGRKLLALVPPRVDETLLVNRLYSDTAQVDNESVTLKLTNVTDLDVARSLTESIEGAKITTQNQDVFLTIPKAWMGRNQIHVDAPSKPFAPDAETAATAYADRLLRHVENGGELSPSDYAPLVNFGTKIHAIEQAYKSKVQFQMLDGKFIVELPNGSFSLVDPFKPSVWGSPLSSLAKAKQLHNLTESIEDQNNFPDSIPQDLSPAEAQRRLVNSGLTLNEIENPTKFYKEHRFALNGFVRLAGGVWVDSTNPDFLQQLDITTKEAIKDLVDIGGNLLAAKRNNLSTVDLETTFNIKGGGEVTLDSAFDLYTNLSNLVNRKHALLGTKCSG